MDAYITQVPGLSPELRARLRGTIHDEEHGELSLGQSVWRYEDGRFFVYGARTRKIFYVVVSESPWGSVQIEDFAPYVRAAFPGELHVNSSNGKEIIRFGPSTRLVHISSQRDLSVVCASIKMDLWREIMQPYANTANTKDLDEIHEKLWALPRLDD